MPPPRDPRGVQVHRYTDVATIHDLIDLAATRGRGNAIVTLDGGLWHAFPLATAADYTDITLTPVGDESLDPGQEPPAFPAGETV